MLLIELVPDLSNCIETVAKKEYTEIVRRLLASGQRNKKLYERAELLRAFLETMDFKKLRRESEKHLADGRKVKFVVYLEDGLPKYDMRISPEL